MNYYKDIDFSKYTSIKIGDVRSVLVLEEIGNYDDCQIIGKGNNLLISPNTKIPFAILGKNFEYIKEDSSHIYVGGSTSSGKLFSHCKKNNIANFEFLSHLPGNLGGIVKMNAGLKSYEIFNHIVKVKTKDGYIDKKEIDFSYRNCNLKDIIYEVVLEKELGFELARVEEFKKMRENQPKIPSAGSCFKNPPNDFAGRLIEIVGLKGEKKGSMCFSNIHANFLVNEDKKGSYEDAIYLINLAKKRIFENFGIVLDEEITILK